MEFGRYVNGICIDFFLSFFMGCNHSLNHQLDDFCSYCAVYAFSILPTVLSKDGHGIFNVQKSLTAFCAHEGETRRDKPAHEWNEKNWNSPCTLSRPGVQSVLITAFTCFQSQHARPLICWRHAYLRRGSVVFIRLAKFKHSVRGFMYKGCMSHMFCVNFNHAFYGDLWKIAANLKSMTVIGLHTFSLNQLIFGLVVSLIIGGFFLPPSSFEFWP